MDYEEHGVKPRINIDGGLALKLESGLHTTQTLYTLRCLKRGRRAFHNI